MCLETRAEPSCDSPARQIAHCLEGVERFLVMIAIRGGSGVSSAAPYFGSGKGGRGLTAVKDSVCDPRPDHPGYPPID